MKRFDFPLEKVQQWRREQAGLEEQKLQKLYEELQSIEQQRVDMENEREEAIGAVRDSSSSNAEDRANLDNYREYIRQRLAGNAHRKQECEARAEQQRQVLLEARRSFELLDRLKQKSWAEWILARDKEQEELAAELYLAKRRRGFQVT